MNQLQSEISFFRLLTGAVILFFLFAVMGSCRREAEKKQETAAVTDTTKTFKAIAVLTDKINASPGDAVLLHERAKLYLQQQNFEHALDDMKKALQMDSTRASFFITLSDLYFASGKVYHAKAALEKCLSLDAEHTGAKLKLAEIYFLVKKYKEAVQLLNEVIAKDSHNSKALFIRGMAAKEAGDTARALSDFQSCIETDKNHYDAFMQMGVIHSARHNRLATEYFSGALKINPQSEEALYGRGLFYQDHDDLDKAIQDYTSIVQFNPGSARAHFNLGYIHFNYLKVYNQAIKHYTDAINASQEYTEAYYNRGLCYEAVGNIAAAKDDYEKALSLRPGYEFALAGLNRLKQ